MPDDHVFTMCHTCGSNVPGAFDLCPVCGSARVRVQDVAWLHDKGSDFYPRGEYDPPKDAA